ncbi:serine/threonine-protein kinase TTK/MPS1, partial [Lecanoromycetidae sp. Uapishka_2]
MAGLASPTPLGATYNELPGRSMSRQHMRSQTSRPNLRRGAPLISKPIEYGSGLPQSWKFSMGDSSDDEIPVPPMKFSAEAKALLGDEASVIGGSSPSQKENVQRQSIVQKRVELARKRSPIALGASRLRDRTASPTSSRSGSPRIVRLHASVPAPSSLRKTTSMIDTASPIAESQRDLITPAPRARNHTTTSPSSKSGNASSEIYDSKSTKPSSAGSEAQIEPAPNSREQPSIHEAVVEMGNLSINKGKSDETGMQGSVRIKRVGKVTGRYLSGPARRGMKRRQSEEDQSPVHEDALSSGDQQESAGRKVGQPSPQARSTSPRAIERPRSSPQSPRPERPPHVRFQSQASIITGSPIPNHKETIKAIAPETVESRPKPLSLPSSLGSSGKRLQPMFKVPPLPPLPSRFDQENEPPPTFKRNKTNGSVLSDKPKLSVMSDDKMLIQTPATMSPSRPALAARSQNTPHRPAPPPPKMTMLETATATAGAASAAQKKKRNYISVNGKLFTRLDCVGRGGSSKVYRVMAENYKIFALKRVTLEDQDELAIKGYKGEIDLLRKLEKVDRVVRLFDYEINEDRHTLSVLMEMGESDLNRVLTLRLNAEDAAFDVVFVRYFWKEMLECVQAVHQHEIVHSDLKPANFLLLQGRLKLIDFGISNAIADDTVNVHREQHIGTPNYMSPEALIDSNAANGLAASAGKMMKLGKASDVWSLGCILYQMVYGKPPFAHIANQMQRIMAIPNPNHVINFPDLGVGGVAVPRGLIRTLQRCLNRDPRQRPTVDELLSTSDAFLYPDVPVRDMVPIGQELIARLQHNIIKHIREKGMPDDVELATWPARFFASIKAAVEEGRA